MLELIKMMLFPVIATEATPSYTIIIDVFQLLLVIL